MMIDFYITMLSVAAIGLLVAIAYTIVMIMEDDNDI